MCTKTFCTATILLFFFCRTFPVYKSVSHLLIQIFIAFIQVFMLQAPFIFNMDVCVEFPSQRLGQLYTKKKQIQTHVNTQILKMFILHRRYEPDFHKGSSPALHTVCV